MKVAIFERQAKKRAQKKARAEFFASTPQRLPNGKLMLSFWVSRGPEGEKTRETEDLVEA